MFVLMSLETKKQYRKPGEYARPTWPTLQGARGAATRLNKKNGNNDLIAISWTEWDRLFNPLVTVKNLMTGADVQISYGDVGTCIDPSTETYWSM